MNTQDLKSCIRNIRKEYSSDEAYIGFFYVDDSGGLGYLEGNKEGIMHFASNLLEASIEINNRKFDKEELFSLPTNLISENSDFLLSHIVLSKELRSEIVALKKEEHKQTWKGKLGNYVAVGILLFILISILVGAITIISWLF
ncbi:hypothetical protein [uncultured Psychroserpens sp.]|uniref:hypothetical protein n=1 Tax=uncultured Psychroserpens sp. TaxID=255436 RepID=UPI0026123FF0|nr:hypothetical protein [uncultured Psychroserpens sp.]